MADKKKTATAPAPTTSALKEVWADLPTIDILERRLQNPLPPASLPIRLVDEPGIDVDPNGDKRKWYLRWVNTAMPGRFHAITMGMGYVPVTWEELANKEDIADRFEGVGPGIDRNVRRGEQGKDVLMKMPYAYYLRIKKKQQQMNEARNSPKAIKEQLQQEASLRLGQHAPDSVRDMPGDIKEVSRERLESDAD